MEYGIVELSKRPVWEMVHSKIRMAFLLHISKFIYNWIVKETGDKENTKNRKAFFWELCLLLVIFSCFFPATASSLLETHTPSLACRTTKTTLHCKYFFSFQHVRPLSCKKHFRGSILKKVIFIGKLQLYFGLKPSPFSHSNHNVTRRKSELFGRNLFRY